MLIEELTVFFYLFFSPSFTMNIGGEGGQLKLTHGYSKDRRPDLSNFSADVCPDKANTLSKSQSCRSNSQKLHSWDGGAEGDRCLRAHRQRHLRGGGEMPGRSASEHRGSLEKN